MVFCSVHFLKLFLAMNENFQLCTNYIDEPNDTCMSGVGGAIWCSGDTTQPLLYGVTAFGKSCGSDGNPGVATSVPAFYGWIQSHLTRDESACIGVDNCEHGTCVEMTESEQYIVQWPGYICQGIDACEDGVDQCPSGSSCISVPGSDLGYSCDCGEGFELVDLQCVDIDECVDNPCGDDQACWNTDGGYSCICRSGTEMVDGSCHDINECLEDGTCGENAECTNIENGGGYQCDCLEGFEGDPYRLCERPPQFCNHPKSEGSVKSSVILTGCLPPFEHKTQCRTQCTGGKILSTDNAYITCNCIGDDGGCTWDQMAVDCAKPTKAPTTTKKPTTTVGTTKPVKKGPECPPLNKLYKVMPPVYLECDLGAPVNGAICKVRCNDAGARSSQNEVNCVCRGRKCKWVEWKQLRKNEIKCVGSATSDESSDRNEAMDTITTPAPTTPKGPECPPMKKTLKKYFSDAVDYGSCGTKESFTGTCKLSCHNGEKPNIPKLTCSCKKSKCKVKELKKLKKAGGFSCGMSRTGTRPTDMLQCDNPYEAYGHLFSYGVNMDCSDFNWNYETTCNITCNGVPNVGLIRCVCDEEGTCDWDKKRIIKKKGIKCITEDSPKYGRKRYMQKLRDRSGIGFI
jgi:hypothetical protein